MAMFWLHNAPFMYFDVMTTFLKNFLYHNVFLTSWRFFLTLWTRFWRHDVFMTSWQPFWRHDVFCKSSSCCQKITFLRHDVFLRYFWRHNELLRVLRNLCIIIACFWRLDELFDVMTRFWRQPFLTSRRVLRHDVFWRHGVFLTLWRTFGRHYMFYELFDLMTCFWRLMNFWNYVVFLT